ncbi:MAG: hydroxymethylglutaryl-CoA reductase [Gemmatimonadota bacterium]|nr:hydroxymethylglutaryl-CoA reductase [Gemmatimonadota bacterium]
MPRRTAWSAEALEERVAFLAERGADLPHLTGASPLPDPAELRGNIEHFVGMTQIPTGLIGPLRIRGTHASGDFYVPLATSEGALVASYDRGARLISQAGGAVCLTTAAQLQRAPGFVFASVGEAARFALWAAGQTELFRAAVAGCTAYGRLLDVAIQVEANRVYVVCSFHTGDAAGQNMVTFCTAAICEDILARTPVAPEHWLLESNLSGDKKARTLSLMHPRGRQVSAETVLPAALVRRFLRTTPERMCDAWRMGFVAGVQSGAIGGGGHIANGIAALFMACGQDVACVSEAAVGIMRMEMRGPDLGCTVTLPNLIVGTVGGGTRLPTARECLRILGCEGEGGAGRFAEICAATVLGGEISIVGAMSAGEFASAHRRLGRRPAPRAP